MRVTWVCPFPLAEYGGRPLRPLVEHSSSWVTVQWQALADQTDVEVTCLTPTSNYESGEICQRGSAAVRAVRVPRTREVLLGGYRRMRREILREIEKTDPDLVVVWGTEHLWSHAVLNYDGPVLYRLQGNANSIVAVDKALKGWRACVSLAPVIAAGERMIFRRASLFAVQTAWDLQWVRLFNATASCFLDGCQVGQPFHRPPVRKPLGRAEVLCVGAGSMRKGFSVLVAVAHRLLAHLPELRIHVVGDLSEECRRVHRQDLVELKDCLVLHGRLGAAEICELMSQCSIFFSPTWMESYGLSIVEAQMQRLPVVTSLVGALPALIEHGYDGLLCEPGNAVAFAAAIESLIDNSDRSSDIAAAGERNARRRHDPSKLVEQHLAIYREILKSWGTRNVVA